MAQLIGGLGTSHIPAIGNAIHRGLQNDPYWKPFFDGFPPIRQWLGEKKPDVVVMFYNDHGLNFFLDKMPTFAVGAAAEYNNADEGWGIPTLPPFPGEIAISPRINYTGFATFDDSGADVFALRNVHTVDNIFTLKYTFSSIMGLNLRLRHYWSKVNNKEFFSLGQDGYLTSLTSNDFNHNIDQNANIWNVDMIYVWQFSPGSELSLAWKNSTYTNTNIATQSYLRNLNDTVNQPQNNNFSLKVLYYIDFQSLRKHHKG